MIKINEKLTIKHDNNSVFSDITSDLASFDRGSSTFTYVSTEDSLYVGFKKPINTFFVEFTTANTNDATISVKYYNGSTFTDVPNLHDDTNGFQRSGFVRWDRSESNENNEYVESATTIDSVSKYWYKIDFNIDTGSMVITGINIVFSDDQDLKREIFEISSYLPNGESSHILTHAAARDEIIQALNLKGEFKSDATTGWAKDLSAFDLLDISQVKLASTYLVLSKIMMNVSDQVDDLYMNKSNIYRSLYNDIINNMKIDIDYDDDGEKDRIERQPLYEGFIVRI